MIKIFIGNLKWISYYVKSVYCFEIEDNGNFYKIISVHLHFLLSLCFHKIQNNIYFFLTLNFNLFLTNFKKALFLQICFLFAF